MDVTGHWRKIPEKDSPDFIELSFAARGLLALLWRKVDRRTGALSLGRKGLRAVALQVATAAEWPVVEPALNELIAAGEVQVDGEALIIPRFETSQAAHSMEPEADRKRRQRQKPEEDKGRGPDPDPTPGHVPDSQDIAGHVPACPDTEQTDKTEENRQNRPDPDTPFPPKGGQTGLFRDPDPQPEQASKRLSKATATHVALGLLRELGAARMRVDKGCRQLDEVESNLTHIRGLLLSGHTAEQVRHVIAVCEERAKRDAKAREHFNAVSPFRPKNFGIWSAMTIQQAQVVNGPLTQPKPPPERRYYGTELKKFEPPPEGFPASTPEDEKAAGF